MQSTRTTSVRAISSLKPRLQPGLRFIFQEFGGERCCVLEDSLKVKYHRIGLAEYQLMRYFDGKTLFSEAVARAAMDAGSDALTERDAISVLSWLVANGLADLGGSVPVDVLRETGGRQILSKLNRMTNILAIRIPLGNPDRFFRAVQHRCAFLAGPVFFMIWLLMVGAGVLQVFLNMDRLRAGTEGVLSPDNWVLLLCVWIVIKVWHEFMHGLVAVRLGGSVREVGILFILLMPLAYVDATSSLAFPSKWKRMFVAAAGMYGELFLAGMAALIWAHTDPGLLNTLAMNAMITASVVTLLFNLNPLMRFDGYHILVDWLEMPNLATRSMRLIAGLARRWLLGMPVSDPPDFHLPATWIYLVYGVASLAWKCLIVTTLLVASAMFFQGGGLIFSVVAGLWIIVPLLIRLRDELMAALRTRALPLISSMCRCGAIVTGVLVLLFFPLRVTYVTAGLFRYAAEDIYRAEAPGFVKTVHVTENQSVTTGDPLLTLENPALATRLAMLEADLKRQTIKWRMAHLIHSPARAFAEATARDSLAAQVDELARSIETLTFKAHRDGRVLTSMLESYPDRYVKRGEEILRLADPQGGEIVIPVCVADVDYYHDHIGLPVSVRADGRFRPRKGVMQSIGSRAVRTPDYPELTVAAGGTLPVRPVRGNSGGAPAYELVQPVVWSTVAMVDSKNFPWRPGERVRIKFRSRKTTHLGRQVVQRISGILNHVLARASARRK